MFKYRKIIRIKIYLSTFFDKNGLTISIVFVMLLAMSNALLTIYLKNTAQEYDQTLLKINEIKHRNKEMIRHVNLVDLGFRGYMIVPTAQLLDPFTKAQKQYGPNIDTLAQLIYSQGYDPKKLEPVRAAIADYMKLIDGLVKLKDKGEIDEITEVVRSDPGYAVWIAYKGFSDELLKFENDIHDEIFQRYNFTTSAVAVGQIILLFLSIPTLVLMIFRIRRSRNFRNKLFGLLEQSNKKYIFNRGTKLRSVNHEKIIKNITNNLKHASKFISNIGNGNYDQIWDGMTSQNEGLNKHNIAGELLKMQKMLKVYKERDSLNLWKNKGLSEFSELTRESYSDLGQFSEKMLFRLVEYVKGLQGALYLIKSDDPETLILQASYAAGEDQLQQLHCEQGVVGQSFRMNQTLRLDEIPENYTSISSGLGKTLPRSIILCPIPYDGHAIGVVEISSLESYSDRECSFIESIVEIIGDSIGKNYLITQVN